MAKKSDSSLSEERKARLEAIRLQQKYKAWMRDFGRFVRDRNQAIEWAKGILAAPEVHCILDTETTGLRDAQIVEIAVVRADGETLLNSLVSPSISIPPEVVAIHGISDAMVAAAPTFSELYPKILEASAGKKVIIYNSGFDTRILNYCCKLHELPPLEIDADCAPASACPIRGGLERVPRKLSLATPRRRA